MKIALQCIPCLLNQSLKAIAHSDKELTKIKKKALLNEIMDILKEDELLDLLPAKTGQRVYMKISKFLGITDVFRQSKLIANENGERLYPALKKMVASSDDPLKTAANIAIIGNLIDHGADLQYDLDKEMDQLHLEIDHFEQLKEELGKAKVVLFLGDNTGEIYFDKVFIEEIKKHFDVKIYFGVRSGPIINDATMEDALKAGVDKIASVVEGTQSPGIILTEANDEFMEAYNTADVIISKGQGNFESLSEESKDTNIFFLLKAKCSLMEDVFSVPLGASILAKWSLL
ncbi:MAG: DUF89 domain-containing protein [Candidatus Hodarchaeota archaeon]